MLTLCIAERYYIIGLYRTETFSTMQELEKFRATLDKGTVSWIHGEPVPKRNYSVPAGF